MRNTRPQETVDMLRIICMALLIVFNYVLQSTVLVNFAILGVTPDTALILIVSYGMLRGDVEGAMFGFFTGLAHDMFGGLYIGVYALLGLLIGYAAGKPFKDFFKDNLFLPFFLVVIATVSHQFLFFCISFLFRGRMDLGYYMWAIILPRTIYTAILAIPIYSLMFVINARISRHEEKRRNFFKDSKEL